MKALVVGAGMGGLAAAIELAAAGADVTVIEAAPRAGGKAGIAVIEGLTVDTGPSVLTLPEVFDALFQRAGLSLAEAVTLRQPTPATRYLDPDVGAIDILSGVEPTLDSVRDALGPDAAEQAQRFLQYARRIWDASAQWFVYGPAPTPDRLPSLLPAAVRHLPAIDPLRTMDAALDRLVSHPSLRRIFRRYATYNGSDPRQAPATLHCIAHVEIGLGVYAVQGGIHALVDALVHAATRLGVRFRFGERVASIAVQHRRVTGLTLADGEVLVADAIVANADAAHVLHDLLPSRPRPGFSDRPPSMSGWTAILRARATPDLAGHTVLFPEDYSAEFADIFDRDRPPSSPTVYLCAQHRAHGLGTWSDGTEPVFAMANAPAEPRSTSRDPAVWDALESSVRRRLRSAGLMGVDDAIVWTRTPAGLAQAFPGTRGAIYGSSSNDRTAAFRRPPNRAPRLRGLYLASGSAHPGGGMPLCALSGVQAAQAALTDLGPIRPRW